ncbi:MAG: dephospho-CoA kinase [Acidobacteriota bacterium]|nr:dephospho-CoA kinase [Acidobacteriota bacterium]
MLKVGLTGGLASGKSFVGETLVRLGCYLIQADQLGHEVLMPGGEAFAGVVEYFGTGILNREGGINRKKLAAEVFNSPDRLAALNALVHPPVQVRAEALAAEYATREPRGIVITEAAILIETGSYRKFDRLILVVCTEERQIERAMRRDGSTREEIAARLRRQMPLTQKRSFADYVIDNSGTRDNTLRQTHAAYDSLRRIQA